jgi:hypothetical protein
MRERLEEAEAKVQQLEEKVVKLASELGTVRLEDDVHSQLMDDLALQTANAVKYKQKAARYRAILHDEKRVPTDDVDEHVKTKLHEDSDVASEEERHHRKEFVAQAQKMTQLEQENTTLRNTISRVKEEMQRYEERHHKWQEARQQRDERAATKRKALQEELAQSREENQRLQRDFQSAQESLKRNSESKLPENQKPRLVHRLPPIEQKTTARDSGKSRSTEAGTFNPESKETRPRPNIRGITALGDGVGNAPNRTKIDSSSQRRRPVSMQMAKPTRSTSAATPVVRDETLDLWGLAEGSVAKLHEAQNRGAQNRGASPRTGEAKGMQDRAASGAAAEALWANLKRRTSMSLISNVRSSPPSRAAHGFDGAMEEGLQLAKGLGDGTPDKENIDPVTL